MDLSFKNLLIKTNRLTITCFTLDMAYDVHLNSLDEDMYRYLPDEVFESEEEARETVAFLISCYEGNDGPWVYPILLDGKVNIGYVELVKIKDKYEIGYHIASRYTGLGYASEAVQAFIEHLNVKEVWGICLTENKASLRVLKKTGFQTTFEGIGFYQGKIASIYKSLYQKKKA